MPGKDRSDDGLVPLASTVPGGTAMGAKTFFPVTREAWLEKFDCKRAGLRYGGPHSAPQQWWSVFGSRPS